MRIRLLCTVVLLCLASDLTSFSQDRESDPKFSKASVAESEKRVKKIRQELRERRDHDWAGEYYYGDGLGVNVHLALAPDNGFVFTWHGCLGLYDVNYGDVAFTQGTVKLQFRFPNKRDGFEGIAPELLPVRWGQRHYLIPVDRVVDFTNAINAGTEPSDGIPSDFLLRNGDEKKKVEGVPNLPSEFAAYLLAEPIKAKITSVGQSTVREIEKEFFVRTTYVGLNAGTADRLREGMELYVISANGAGETATVQSVSEHSATAAIKGFGSSDPAPSAGWELSTRMP